jgi:hypothetical protein
VIIAISSAPGVDKSSLVSELSERFSLTAERDPVPGVCRSWGFQTLYEMPLPLQREVRLSLLRFHRDSVVSGRPAIYGFSAFEMLADWMRWFWSSTPTEAWEEVLTLAADCAAGYDAVYHLSGGPCLPYNGFTWFDRRNASQQERLIRSLYLELGVREKVHDGVGS